MDIWSTPPNNHSIRRVALASMLWFMLVNAIDNQLIETLRGGVGVKSEYLAGPSAESSLYQSVGTFWTCSANGSGRIKRSDVPNEAVQQIDVRGKVGRRNGVLIKAHKTGALRVGEEERSYYR